MNTLNDLAALSDEELTELIEAARQILARRAAVALIPAQIESLAREYRESGGEQATLIEALTPVSVWEPGITLGVGDRVEHNGVVYVVRQAHTSQAGWEPTNLPALFTPEES